MVKKEKKHKSADPEVKDVEVLDDEASKSEVVAEDQDSLITLKVVEHQALIDEAASNKEKYLRIYAEFENARKRMDRDKQAFLRYANEGVLVEVLNIFDDLQRSIKAAESKHEDYAAFLKGMEMVMTQMNTLLAKNDVKPIEAKGQKFDPHCHEVLMQEECDDQEEGIILEEFQKGYYLGDKVIRTAKVKVACLKVSSENSEIQSTEN